MSFCVILCAGWFPKNVIRGLDSWLCAPYPRHETGTSPWHAAVRATHRCYCTEPVQRTGWPPKRESCTKLWRLVQYKVSTGMFLTIASSVCCWISRSVDHDGFLLITLIRNLIDSFLILSDRKVSDIFLLSCNKLLKANIHERTNLENNKVDRIKHDSSFKHTIFLVNFYTDNKCRIKKGRGA